MNIKCNIILSSLSEHLTQILSGFGVLQKNNIIELSISKDKKFEIGHLSKPILKVIINNSIKVVYDTFDGSSISVDDYNWCDFYFKRSFDRVLISDSYKLKKIFPLGLNYSVYGPNNFYKYKLYYSISSVKSVKNIKNLIIPLIRTSKNLSRIFKTSNGCYTSFYQNFESIPRFEQPPKILFLTRLWDPNRTKSKKLIEERHFINQMRIDIIRSLKKEFPKIFVGGLAPDEFTNKAAPDCIVTDQKIIQKKEYLASLKTANICISNQGLLGSNGWKLAEYVAGAKSIVSEKLNYEVPGNFLSGKNYLEFSTIDDCIQKVDFLVKDPDLRYKMMVENYNYYHQFLRPDMLIWNTLKEVF